MKINVLYMSLNIIPTNKHLIFQKHKLQAYLKLQPIL
jgi:hypothetical protein